MNFAERRKNGKFEIESRNPISTNNKKSRLENLINVPCELQR